MVRSHGRSRCGSQRSLKSSPLRVRSSAHTHTATCAAVCEWNRAVGRYATSTSHKRGPLILEAGGCDRRGRGTCVGQRGGTGLGRGEQQQAGAGGDVGRGAGKILHLKGTSLGSVSTTAGLRYLLHVGWTLRATRNSATLWRHVSHVSHRPRAQGRTRDS